MKRSEKKFKSREKQALTSSKTLKPTIKVESKKQSEESCPHIGIEGQMPIGVTSEVIL